MRSKALTWPLGRPYFASTVLQHDNDWNTVLLETQSFQICPLHQFGSVFFFSSLTLLAVVWNGSGIYFHVLAIYGFITRNNSLLLFEKRERLVYVSFTEESAYFVLHLFPFCIMFHFFLFIILYGCCLLCKDKTSRSILLGLGWTTKIT